MALSVSCTCCTLVRASAGCCGYLCYPFSCHETITLVIKPCALLPNLVHLHCTLVPGMLCHPSHGTDCPMWGSLATPTKILSPRYLNSDLTLPLNRYHGPLWYFVRRGSPVLTFFPLDQTNWFFKLLNLYLSQRFCEQVRRVILPWDMTNRDSLVFDLFPYIMVTNIHMLDPRLLCWIHC